MEAFLATFAVVFLAEMGDKTQLLVMAFAAKFRWQQVLVGMTAGIFVVHALAVGVGSLVHSLINPQLMEFIAALLFLGFGVWTLRGGDEEEEESAGKRFGPVLTVMLTFIVGEMGDKTQFAAMTMAATLGAWLPVLLGAVSSMVLADGLGLVAGTFLQRHLQPARMRLLSGGIFLGFGAVGLIHAAWQFFCR
ncbi:MAG: TMEM165/GDT1 family protein [Selenomonadaceae bacterium]|jgi:putative Ca2+/H+ antiporter (TMEM165/GDT1 family)|nr:TMEM165/GDT1 family protein [Selenomonadaceae bacterium]MDD7055833.1 TMEM165/GDT1 family protein [Selenomonadaceae bacterium]MDY3916699.1 TMEM165/GDT1 family protein [Selenomonadaceae bacterium]